jgi:hypothetical protein
MRCERVVPGILIAYSVAWWMQDVRMAQAGVRCAWDIAGFSINNERIYLVLVGDPYGNVSRTRVI